ncbi:heterokaryon incompatibility protein-domain-containing protein [Trametes maxima]|nr:heterokaryon incompatibility protein-domain-containing protein [Trametes maxima]
MWLLSTTNPTLRFFEDNEIPQYAILSHVWRGGEQSLQEVMAIVARSAQGYGDPGVHPNLSAKIRGFCTFADNAGYKWVWIDTCCIDKSSSAELSEALNSMYSWYANADMCYALLDDVHGEEDPRSPSSTFRRSSWFTRGWTLQELLAPHSVIFLSSHWQSIGTNHSLADVIERITGIDHDILTHKRPLSSVSVARRMSWASRRKTRRIEDRAYSLMGIFNVYMPTVYGEGARAFTRLQEEILKQLSDQSIFVWGPLIDINHEDTTKRMFERPLSPGTYRSRITSAGHRSLQGLLAHSPEDFANSANIHPVPFNELSEALGTNMLVPVYHPTCGGLRIQMPIIEDWDASNRGPLVVGSSVSLSFAVLACKDAQGKLVILYLRKESREADAFSIGVPTKRRYFRTALWDWRAHRPRRAEVLDVYVMHCRQEAPLLPYFPIHQFSVGPNSRSYGSTSIFFFFPAWVLSRLQQAGFVPVQNVAGFALQPLRTSDGHSVELRRQGHSLGEETVSSLLLYGLGVGNSGGTSGTYIAVSFGLGCGQCPQTNTMQDIWVSCKVNDVEAPHSGSISSTRFPAVCSRSHLSHDLSEKSFRRGTYLIQCRIAPWCGYPMRSNAIASCQYLADIRILDSSAEWSTSLQLRDDTPLVPPTFATFPTPPSVPAVGPLAPTAAMLPPQAAPRLHPSWSSSHSLDHTVVTFDERPQLLHSVSPSSPEFRGVPQLAPNAPYPSITPLTSPAAAGYHLLHPSSTSLDALTSTGPSTHTGRVIPSQRPYITEVDPSSSQFRYPGNYPYQPSYQRPYQLPIVPRPRRDSSETQASGSSSGSSALSFHTPSRSPERPLPYDDPGPPPPLPPRPGPSNFPHPRSRYRPPTPLPQRRPELDSPYP